MEAGDNIVGPAFVAGATGFTGREVVRVLAEKGVPVTAHLRPDSSRLEYWREHFQGLGAEVNLAPWEERAMTETLTRLKPGLVFALLGTTRARVKKAARMGFEPREHDYDAVDYGYTAMLVRALKSACLSPRFVYLSAVGVTQKSRSPYYRARARAEGELKDSGLPYVIARPSFITGPGRDDPRPGERVGAAAIDGLLRLAGMLGAGKLRDRYLSTTNVVLANGLVRLALDPGAANRAFESEDLK